MSSQVFPVASRLCYFSGRHQRRQRAAKLMAGVGEEGAVGVVGMFELVEHLVIVAASAAIRRPWAALSTRSCSRRPSISRHLSADPLDGLRDRPTSTQTAAATSATSSGAAPSSSSPTVRSVLVCTSRGAATSTTYAWSCTWTPRALTSTSSSPNAGTGGSSSLAVRPGAGLSAEIGSTRSRRLLQATTRS